MVFCTVVIDQRAINILSVLLLDDIMHRSVGRPPTPASSRLKLLNEPRSLGGGGSHIYYKCLVKDIKCSSLTRQTLNRFLEPSLQQQQEQQRPSREFLPVSIRFLHLCPALSLT